MKIVKYVVLFLLIAIIGLAIYAAVQPNSYEVTRSRIIDVPAKLVYNNVSDYKNWEAWGPWLEEDPSMTFSYGETTKGEGASYSWEGKDGKGSQKMTSAIPHESLTTELTFEGMGSASAFWKFDPNVEGTEVTWGMKADNVPYLFKFFGAISGGYDKMMGPMFERGLERLDSVMVIEAEAYNEMMSAWSLGEVSKMTIDKRNFIGYAHSSKMDQEAMSKLFQESMPKLGEYAVEQGLQYGDFTPGAIFTKWDETTGETDFMIGVFLKEALKPAEDMQSMSFAKGTVVTVSKFGNYGIGDREAHLAIEEFMETHKMTMAGPVYELYVNDPTLVTPDKIQTDIYYPIK